MLSTLRLSKFFTSFALGAVLISPQAFAQQERGATIAGDDQTAKYLQNFATYYGIDVDHTWEYPPKSNDNLPSMQADNIDEIIALSKDLINNQTFINPLFGKVFSNFAILGTNIVDNQYTATSPTEQALQDMIATEPLFDTLCNRDLCILNNKQLDELLRKVPEDPYEANKEILAELNAEALLAPLTYSAEDGGLSYGSPARGDNDTTPKDEKETAFRYIRYVSRQVDPLFHPSNFQYQREWDAATKDPNKDERARATYTIANYLINQRTYAAQASIGISNLNTLLARRVSNPGTAGKSQLETEYQMATHRLEEGKWQKEMEQAAPVVLQQQMLFLLAEINYQLYLSRQQNERILATLSAMQLHSIQDRKSELFFESHMGEEFYD